MNRSPEELAASLTAIDAGDIYAILTPSADFAELAQRRGYRVVQVNAGMESLYEIRAADRRTDAYGAQPDSHRTPPQ